jgi:parvulin-like peptidyl-prolyl isomerase
VEHRVGPSIDEPASSGLPTSHLKRWRREPLLHFLLAGLALFAGYRLLHQDVNGRDSSDRIVLTEDDLRQMKVAWLGQGRPSPTPEEMRNLIEGKVREEVLYREALALGLDKGDTIVKRRLAQKMEFLAEDLTGVSDPTTEEFKTWFEKNRERFALPPRLSFRHLYFSPDRRGTRAKEAATSARERLAGKPAGSPVSATLADSFMFQNDYRDRTLDQVADVFGTTFATALFQLTPGSWQGPIESGLGWHVAWVESITPGRVPSFEEIEQTIKSAWTEEQRAESRRRAFDAMKARYEVVLPNAPAMVGMMAGTTEAKGAP